MDKTKVTKDLENKKLIIERTFDAPKDKLWRAYADKAWFEAWWGPEGWQTTTKEFNFTVGGRVHYRMECVDKNQGEWFGQVSWGLMEFVAIDEPNKLETKDYFSAEDGKPNTDMPAQRFSVEFIEEDGKTRLVSTSICDTAEQLEELLKMGMAQGFASQLNRLEALLAKDK